MDTNFQIFVIISTIISYVLINSKTDNKGNYNYIYTPLILYSGYYLFNSTFNTSNISHYTSDVPVVSDVEELLSIPFPVSTESF